MNKTDRSKLEVAKDLYHQTYSVDINNVDNVKRNPRWAQAIIQSYSRNICTLAESKTILGDVKANFDISQPTFDDYIQALEKLYIIEDVDAWCPAIRSKSAIRSSKKTQSHRSFYRRCGNGLISGIFQYRFQNAWFSV